MADFNLITAFLSDKYQLRVRYNNLLNNIRELDASQSTWLIQQLIHETEHVRAEFTNRGFPEDEPLDIEDILREKLVELTND